MIVDNLGTSNRDDNELRYAPIEQRGRLAALAGEDGRHCCFGDCLLQPLEASLHLGLHGHAFDRVYPG